MALKAKTIDVSYSLEINGRDAHTVLDEIIYECRMALSEVAMERDRLEHDHSDVEEREKTFDKLTNRLEGSLCKILNKLDTVN